VTDSERLSPGARVGFVGLGRMGVPMAVHLAVAGYRVAGHDVSDQARERFAAVAARASAPVEVPGTLEAVARDADAVILMLPDSRVVKQVTGGPVARLEGDPPSVTRAGGLLSAMPAGSLLIDMSSSDPAATERLARQAAAKDIAVVGAPVSGGVIGAEQAA
jgi:3-hydroxyisobutyrate dehydrogenase